LGDPDGALRNYTQAITIEPTYATGWYNRANTYKQLKKWAQAAADYRQALAIARDDWDLRESAERRLKDVEEKLKTGSEF
jgi:tetratricopeptide (TPR) repeat protein